MTKNNRPESLLSRSSRIPTDWKPEANDVIIPLMGPTGAGKSTFINFIAGKEVTTVGHALKSCTATLLPVVIDSSPSDLLEGGRLVLVDTPGFGDTHVDDVDILRDISSWLETMYDPQDAHGHKGETRLAGIVYLHDISLTRMLGSTRKNLDVFEKLCGKDALQRVVLCTTKWSDIYQEDGDRRTEQLRNNYWKEMIEAGSTVRKFEDSQKSAWDVIVPIIKGHQKMDALQIQKELVELKKVIPDTEAGQQLRYSLDQLLKSLKEASSKDPSRRKELDTQIVAIRDQMRAMRVPLTQRILRLFNLRVDKILDKFMLMNATPPSSSTGNKFLVPAVGARLEADVKELIMLLGGTEKSYKKLLTLSAAEITNFGGSEQATTEVRCWSVERKSQKPLLVVTAPSSDSVQSGNPAVFEKVRNWLSNSCREDMQFGIIFLHDSSLSEPPHGACVKQSDLKSNTLFATFAREASDTVKYDFDGGVASFRETNEQALKMFDIVLSKPVGLDKLLEEQQTISEGATNREQKALESQLTRTSSPQSSDVRPGSPPHGEKSPPHRTISPKPKSSSSSIKEVHEKQKEPSTRHSKLSIRLPFGKKKKGQEPLPPASSHLTPMREESYKAVTPADDEVDQSLKQLTAMGFSRSAAVVALENNGYDVQKALNSLFGQ